MIPFLTFKKQYVINKPSYNLFNRINDETFGGDFRDLGMTVGKTDPLKLKFELHRNLLGIRPRLNANLWAKFEDVENRSHISVEITSSFLCYIFLTVLTISFFFNLYKGSINLSAGVSYIIILIVFSGVDLLAKRDLLNRFETLVSIH